MSKATPGPWLHRAKSDSVHKPPSEQPYKFGDVIFQFHDEQGPSDADLALILAAPDLLAALNAMLTHMGMDEDEWNKPTFNQARAAIAKAEAA